MARSSFGVMPDGTEVECVTLRDADGLERALEEILADPARAAILGRNALKVVKENLGAMERTVEMIVQKLDDGEMFVAGK